MKKVRSRKTEVNLKLKRVGSPKSEVNLKLLKKTLKAKV